MSKVILSCLLATSLQIASANVIVVPRGSIAERQRRATPSMSRMFAHLRSLALYDCSFGFLDAIKDWPESKREFCCQENHLLCSAPRQGPSDTVVNGGYDCYQDFARWEEKWSVGKKAWCCGSFNRGCTAEAKYDCSADFVDWRDAWAAGKKAFCCQHEQLGCEVVDAIVPEPKGKHHFDCEATSDNWKVEWSEAKKAWCNRSGATPLAGVTPMIIGV